MLPYNRKVFWAKALANFTMIGYLFEEVSVAKQI